MIRRLSLLLLLFMVVLPLLGCPGNTARDKEAQATLWAWIEEREEAGWEIIGYPGTADIYKNMILEHNFRPTRLDIAINTLDMNPYHQRNWIEQIAVAWRDQYPANMTPRFTMRVTLYDATISNDNELGFTEISNDGRVVTHHGKTQDVM